MIPPKGAKVVQGRNWAAVIPPISRGDEVRVVARSGRAANRIPSPMLVTKVAVSKAEKSGPKVVVF